MLRYRAVFCWVLLLMGATAVFRASARSDGSPPIDDGNGGEVTRCPAKKAYNTYEDVAFVLKPGIAGLHAGYRASEAEAAEFCRYEPTCTGHDSSGGYVMGAFEIHGSLGTCSYAKDPCPPLTGFTSYPDVAVALTHTNQVNAKCFLDVYKHCHSNNICFAFDKMRYEWIGSANIPNPHVIIDNLVEYPGGCVYVKTPGPPPQG